MGVCSAHWVEQVCTEALGFESRSETVGGTKPTKVLFLHNAALNAREVKGAVQGPPSVLPVTAVLYTVH